MSDITLDIPTRYLPHLEAYEMGASDFEAGLPRRPLGSPWLCESYRIGGSGWRSGFEAWLAGWDAASLARPLG